MRRPLPALVSPLPRCGCVLGCISQVVWGEVLKHEKLTFPRNPSEVPDIFFYIVDRDNRCLSYHRMSAAEAIEAGWSAKARWVDFVKDPAVDGLATGGVCLSLLVCSAGLLKALSVLFGAARMLAMTLLLDAPPPPPFVCRVFPVRK